MNLWGRSWTRDEIRPHAGRMAQIAGITRTELQDGFERGVEMLEVRTGSGLRFGVCPSRGLDITFAEHNGRSLAWQSATGWRHPAYFEASNLGWLRGFGGGLLTTCGFASFGPPCEDEGEQYGIHDRASYLPAENVNVREAWNGDDYVLSIEGRVRQTRVFAPNITLTRRISARAGEGFFAVHDTLRNEGFQPAPAVILYHCNFGFPVVSEHSRVELPAQRSTPRDEAAAKGTASWAQLEAPQPDYAERVYFHDVEADANGRVRAAIRNETMNFGAYVEYSPEELPYFTQWKMMGAGDYVCGLEPSNAPLASRADLRASGNLPELQPGETRDFNLKFGIL
jgi:hypothetical protein